MPTLPAPVCSALGEPCRIVVRGVNWLGDAVMTTPALQRLRERFPQASIHLLSLENLAQLWRHHPAIDEVIGFAKGTSPWTTGRRLRPAGFDLALVLPNSPRAALEMWLARIPRRVGYAQPWRDWWLTEPVKPRPGYRPMRKRSAGEIKRLITQHNGTGRPPSGRQRKNKAPDPIDQNPPHQIYDYLQLTAALGANPAALPPLLVVDKEELEAAEEKWLSGPRQIARARPLIPLGLNPSAAYGPAKRWPIESFAAAVREVSRRMGNCIWLVFGRAEDELICREIAQRSGTDILNLAGKTNLRELMALLKLCRVMLTNDSGPMHVAAALGTPVVVPFGSTTPELTSPGLPGQRGLYLLRSDAPCSPCFRRVCPIDLRCMTGISVQRVVESVLDAVGSANPG